MPIEVLTVPQARRFFDNNAEGRFPDAARDPERLLPIPRVRHTPKFDLSRDEPIYVIGSCFARVIAQELAQLGYAVHSLPRAGEFADIPGGKAFFHKYNPQAVLQEFRWALDPEHPHPGVAAFVETSRDRYLDLNLGGKQPPRPKDELLQLRSDYDRHVARAAACPVVMMVIGYVEVWYDRQAGIYLNMSPRPPQIERFPGRFEMQVLGYAEALSAFRETWEVLRRFGHPDVKLLCTVSPVPLRRTFRGSDILEASSYSKAVLRAALEEFCSSNPSVAYFPGYEMVGLTDPSVAFGQRDYRHVNDEMVSHLTSTMMAAYVPSGDRQSAAEQHLSKGRVYFKSKQFEDARAEFETAVKIYPTSAAHLRLAGALRELGLFEDALIQLDVAEQLEPDIKILRQRAFCLEHLGRQEEAMHVARAVLEVKEEDNAMLGVMARALLSP